MKTRKFDFSARLDCEFKNSLPMNSSAKLYWSELEDDGGGYYDYRRIGFSLEHEIDLKPYNLVFEIGIADSTYDLRRVELGHRFKRQNFSSAFSITRSLNESTSAYLRWTREEDFSNARDFEYFANFLSIGLNWEL